MMLSLGRRCQHTLPALAPHHRAAAVSTLLLRLTPLWHCTAPVRHFTTPAGTSGWSAVPPLSEQAKEMDAAAVAADAASGIATLVRCIDKEIDDEDLRIDKESPKLPDGWDIEHIEGSSYWTMKRVWDDRERHTVRCQLTTRDVALDPECDIRGEHFPFRLTVEELKTKKAMEFTMDVVEGECIIDNVRTYDTADVCTDEAFTAVYERSTAYAGPNLDEAEEETLDALQSYLAERNIDDQFAEFVGQYSVWVEQTEYERWLRELKAFVQA